MAHSNIKYNYPNNDAVISLIKVLDAFDSETAEHSKRVSELSVKIAKALNLPPFQIEGIKIGALLHDIGKLAIPSRILLKSGKLTESEFNSITNHTVIGASFIEHIKFPWPVQLMIKQHHELIDGSGYPLGLKGHQICIEAKIITIADVFDALYSRRSYKEAYELDFVLNTINQFRNIKYDDSVISALETVIKNNLNTLIKPEDINKFKSKYLK